MGSGANRNRGKRAGQEQVITARREQAFSLRTDRMPYKGIADRLGVSEMTARKDVKAVTTDLIEETREQADQARELELAALDKLQSRWMGFYDSVTDDSSELEPPLRSAVMERATRSILSIMKHRAELLGLLQREDVTQNVLNITVQQGNPYSEQYAKGLQTLMDSQPAILPEHVRHEFTRIADRMDRDRESIGGNGHKGGNGRKT